MKYAIIICALALTISSCKKEEAAKLTMVGTWTVDSYYENDVDQTTIYKAANQDYKIVYDASNYFIETYKTGGVSITNAGTWKLTNGEVDLQMTNQADNSLRTLRIIEINPESSKLTEGSKRFHLVKI